MSDGVFNIAKGKVNEYVARVDANDPANSAIIVVPVDRAAVTDATLKDFDTLAAILAGGVTERSSNNWNRKTLTDSDISAPVVDDTNDRLEADLPDLTWSPGPTSGAVTDLLVCYDPDTTGGTDAAVIPLTWHGFAVTPDGNIVLASINAAGFFRAS